MDRKAPANASSGLKGKILPGRHRGRPPQKYAIKTPLKESGVFLRFCALPTKNIDFITDYAILITMLRVGIIGIRGYTGKN